MERMKNNLTIYKIWINRTNKDIIEINIGNQQ